MNPGRHDTMGDRRITLEHLRAFVAVAEQGGFLEAGNHIYRTQSAVTQSVKRLEDILRCRLFDRGKGQITGLTPDGARFLPGVKDTLARLDHAVKALQQPELSGHITLGMQPSTHTDELRTAIASCMTLNKGLRIQVVSEASTRLVDMLDHGELDVAILCREHEEVMPEGMTQYTLKIEPTVWVGQGQEDIASMAEIPLVVPLEGGINRRLAVEALKEAGRAYYFSFVTPSWEGVCKAVAAGFGICAFGKTEVEEGHTVLPESRGLPPLPPMYTVLRARTQSPVIQQFCDIIRNLPGFR